MRDLWPRSSRASHAGDLRALTKHGRACLIVSWHAALHCSIAHVAHGAAIRVDAVCQDLPLRNACLSSAYPLHGGSLALPRPFKAPISRRQKFKSNLCCLDRHAGASGWPYSWMWATSHVCRFKVSRDCEFFIHHTGKCACFALDPDTVMLGLAGLELCGQTRLRGSH